MIEYLDIKPVFAAIETQALFVSKEEPKLEIIMDIAQYVNFPFKLFWITHGTDLYYYRTLDTYGVPLHAHFVVLDPRASFFTKALNRFDVAYVPELLRKRGYEFHMRTEPTVEEFVRKLMHFSNPENIFSAENWRTL